MKVYILSIYNDVDTFNMATDTLFNENERKELNFVGCTNCGCVQLHNLYIFGITSSFNETASGITS